MFVLLHQGGWDEVLYFVVPVVLGFFGLRYAEKRAKEKAALQDASAEESPEAVDAGDEED